MSNKEHVIVYGDVDKFVKQAMQDPSTSLQITPLLEKLQKDFNTTINDLSELLTNLKSTVVIYLTSFYRDREHLIQEFNESCEAFCDAADTLISDDDMRQYWVIGMGNELVVINFDAGQVSTGEQLRKMNFPEGWVEAEAPLLMWDGKVKRMSRGFNGTLNQDVLTSRLFSYLRVKDKDLPVDLDRPYTLEYLNWCTVVELNEEERRKNSNASFTIFVKKSKAAKFKLQEVK